MNFHARDAPRTSVGYSTDRHQHLPVFLDHGFHGNSTDHGGDSAAELIEKLAALVPASERASGGLRRNVYPVSRTCFYVMFWQKDEEDADPAKDAQYGRWRELRRLQEASVAPARQ